MASLRFAKVLGLAACVSVLTPAFPLNQDAPKALFRLAKDSDYVYLTIKVESSDIQGLEKGSARRASQPFIKMTA